MFEFFDNYDDGVPEPWAKDIMACVLISVNACHEAGVCHRDLKPENILISFDTKKGAVTSFKLCDFGLGAPFTPGDYHHTSMTLIRIMHHQPLSS